jgi:hypothetical protein
MPDRQIPCTLPRVITNFDPAAGHAHKLIADKLAHRLFLARSQNDDKTSSAYARQELTSALDAARLRAGSQPTDRRAPTIRAALRGHIRATGLSKCWLDQALSMTPSGRSPSAGRPCRRKTRPRASTVGFFHSLTPGVAPFSATLSNTSQLG